VKAVRGVLAKRERGEYWVMSGAEGPKSVAGMVAGLENCEAAKRVPSMVSVTLCKRDGVGIWEYGIYEYLLVPDRRGTLEPSRRGSAGMIFLSR
jgi:hypothetical protein